MEIHCLYYTPNAITIKEDELGGKTWHEWEVRNADVLAGLGKEDSIWLDMSTGGMIPRRLIIK